MFYELSTSVASILFIAGLFIGGVIGTILGYSLYAHNIPANKKRMHTPEDVHKRVAPEKNPNQRANQKPKQSNSTNTNQTDREKFFNNRENELNRKEELLNDREMALAEGLDEIVSLKDRVDTIINEQKEELFSYCSVSEESALKMKEVTLEVQKKLKETIEKIQE